MRELNSTEFDVLARLVKGEAKLDAIAAAIGRSPNRISIITADLEKKGCLVRFRVGMSYRIKLSDNGFVNPLRRLLQDGLPIKEYLANSRMIVLTTIADANWLLGARDIEWLTGLSRSSVSLAIHDALRYGILKKEGRKYRWGGRMDVLRSFLTEFSKFDNARVASSIVQGSSVIWQLGPDFIIMAPTEATTRPMQPTGVTAFNANDLEIVSNMFFYHITGRNRTLRIEDHAIDNIILDRKSVIQLTYSLIYLKMNIRKIEWHYLNRLCDTYGLGDLGERIAKYLRHGQGALRGFPTDKEFQEKLAMYGE